MTPDEIKNLIDFLTHIEFTLGQLGNYAEAPESLSPVTLTHCAKFYVAKNAITEIQYRKFDLYRALKQAHESSPFTSEF